MAETMYAGLIFTPSVATNMCNTACMTFAADATHCDAVGTQLYGIIFDVVMYEANNQLKPLVFSHSIL